MVELMAVLVIIGLLATLVVTKVATKIDQARVTTTKANLKLLHNAVNQFKMDTSRFPSEEGGLKELIEQPTDVANWEPGGYLETTEIPKDGWGNDFIYERFPESGKPFVIKSFGADGKEGGDGYDADLYSTDAF
jgi:general secretion pathway protein G